MIWRRFLNAKNPLFNQSTFSPFWSFSMIQEIGIRSTSFSRQVSVWPVHENVISPRCDQFKNNQLPHWGEASVRWGKIQRLLMTFSGEHAPKISNRFLIITTLGIIIIILTAVIIAITVIIIRIRTAVFLFSFSFDLHFYSYLFPFQCWLVTFRSNIPFLGRFNLWNLKIK